MASYGPPNSKAGRTSGRTCGRGGRSVSVLLVFVFLKLAGAGIVLIGLLHASLGVSADRMLDRTVPLAALDHASLDSQNRFYGATFAVFGVLLWLCSTDMTRYSAVFRVLMIVFFAGGLTRIVSTFVKGLPSASVRALAVIELVVPPIMLWWQASL